MPENIPNRDAGSSFNARLLLGIAGVAAFYWLFEILLQIGSTSRPSFIDLLVGADMYDSLRRVVVLVFFIIFASHIQYTLEGRRKAEIALLRAMEEEAKLQNLAISLSRELNLGRLLQSIMETACEILNADRGSIFMQEEKTGELRSLVAMGMESSELRFPSNLGLAGACFTESRTINVNDAYLDKRFHSGVDQSTGYVTRSVLCIPFWDKKGKTMGVIELINKKGGPFSPDDENRLETFGAQVSVAIENAALFEDVLSLKNYSESVLESLTNGVISLDTEGRIVKCNTAALEILYVARENLIGHAAGALFPSWVAAGVRRVMQSGRSELIVDEELPLPGGASAAVNVTTVPLRNAKNEIIGAILIIEDITREKRVKSTMARYMTKEVAEKLLESDESVLGGVEQEATVLFSDIRNFTPLAEKMPPREAVQMLNDYFTVMVDIVFRRQGVLDKYIGDGLMAVFGAPVKSDRDPDRAVRAAVEMMDALAGFNSKRIQSGKSPINIGIGINTDEIISGNIGSVKRMDYTVIGDGVNLAFRLEQANKYYGSNILFSEFTKKRLKDRYSLRKLDIIRVKGKDRPVAIYQLLDHMDERVFPHIKEVIGLYKEGLAEYQAGNWEKGLRRFEAILKLNPNDNPSRIFQTRCSHYLTTPPPANWDGVWTMEGRP